MTSSADNGGSDLDFLSEEERTLSAKVLETGYIIAPVERHDLLDRIRDRMVEHAASYLGMPVSDQPGAFLDGIAAHVSQDKLNNLRLAVFNAINAESWFRPAYYALARSAIATLIGNELVMQRRVNLSIQMPDDESSILPLHADVWSGDSAFEMVLWLPLVDCIRTKSMFLLPPERNAVVQRDLASSGSGKVEEIYESIESDLIWMNIRYGEFLLFNQNLLHGNRVNRESTTRWSMNCRFKSLLSPYADKRLGEFFEPITIRAATRIGMTYRLPDGFSE